MKIFLLLSMLLSSVFAKQYVFWVNKYSKEIELEAKIISKIARSSVKDKKIRLYIPNISEDEREVYSQYFSLAEDCESANFVFDTKGLADEECKRSGKLFFTNNYRRLVSDHRYYGAFFWSKSRPNIVFIKHRLQNFNVKLADEYSKYIEEINE